MISKYMNVLTWMFFLAGGAIGIAGGNSCCTISETVICVIAMMMMFGLGAINAYATEGVMDLEDFYKKR